MSARKITTNQSFGFQILRLPRSHARNILQLKTSTNLNFIPSQMIQVAIWTWFFQFKASIKPSYHRLGPLFQELHQVMDCLEKYQVFMLLYTWHRFNSIFPRKWRKSEFSLLSHSFPPDCSQLLLALESQEKKKKKDWVAFSFSLI